MGVYVFIGIYAINQLVIKFLQLYWLALCISMTAAVTFFFLMRKSTILLRNKPLA